MAALDFPNNPTVGQTFPDPVVVGQPVWRWDGEKWVGVGSGGGGGGGIEDAPADGVYGRTEGFWQRAVAVSGDVMTGNLTLPVLNSTTISNSDTIASVGAIQSTSGNITAGSGASYVQMRPGGTLHATSSISAGSGGISTTGTIRAAIGATYTDLYAGGGVSTTGQIVGYNLSIGGGNSNIAGALAVTGNLATASQFGSSFTITGYADLAITTNIVAGMSVIANVDGFKPGGGPWSAWSDARIKDVLRDYDAGLAQIETLTPVVYKFKGNDTSDKPSPLRRMANGSYTTSPHRQMVSIGREFVGLIAQDCEATMPEMVRYGSSYIDGEYVDDMRILDTSPLVFALINTCKELAARVRALEGER